MYIIIYHPHNPASKLTAYKAKTAPTAATKTAIPPLTATLAAAPGTMVWDGTGVTTDVPLDDGTGVAEAEVTTVSVKDGIG